MANEPISRRSALRTGGLAALTASLLGSLTPSRVGAAPAPTPPACKSCTSALDEGLAEWFAEWSAERLEVGRKRDALARQVHGAPEHETAFWSLCRDACDLHGDEYSLDEAFTFELLCYHLPALAPTLRAIRDHINEELYEPAMRGELDRIVGCCQDRRLF